MMFLCVLGCGVDCIFVVGSLYLLVYLVCIYFVVQLSVAGVCRCCDTEWNGDAYYFLVFCEYR